MASTLLQFADQCGRYGAIYKAEQIAALKLSVEATELGITVNYRRRGWNPGSKEKKISGSGLGPLWFSSRLLSSEAAIVLVRGGAAHAFEFGAGVYGPKHSPWIIYPSKTHLRRGTRRKTPLATGAKALKTPWGPKAWVEHRGFRGRPFFEGGLRLAEPVVVKVMDRAVVNTMRKTFR